MSRIVRNTSGGKAVSGGALGLRTSRPNSTFQVDAYRKGGGGLPAPATIRLLVVAGGGYRGTDASGGTCGGAGGYRAFASEAVAAGTEYSIAVGGAGGNSSAFGKSTNAGGGGAAGDHAPNGLSGGSGGGANTLNGGQGANGTGGAGNVGGFSPVEGYAGQNTTWNDTVGGGGAGAVGGFYGGAGVANDITGTSVTYSKGGGNAAHDGGYGNGASRTQAGVAGRVIFSHSDAFQSGTTTGTCTKTAVGGNIIYDFASAGTVVWT